MLTVSNYHYIREDFSAPYPSIFGLTPAQFECQLVKLKCIGEFIHPRDLIANIEEIISSKVNYLLVTFDDGLKEQYELAKPILDKLNISALFFINSINFIEKKVSTVHKIHLLRSQFEPQFLLNHIKKIEPKLRLSLTAKEKNKAEIHYNYDDSQSAHLKYILNFKLSVVQQSKLIHELFGNLFNSENIVKELYMTEEMIIDLASKGMLGSHTHSHLALGTLASETIYQELSKTKLYLEQLTNYKINCVSYPYGSSEACAKPVPDLAASLGYTIGFSMERGINTSLDSTLILKRFDCNDLPGGKNEKYFKNEYSSFYK